MIRRIEVLGEGLTSPLPMGVSAESDSVQVLDIQGLEPIKAALSSTPYATRRGAYFQGSRVESRNLVFKLGLNPNWADQTISSLRKLLYGYFMTEQTVSMRFFSDDFPPVDISGIVETCDPNAFAKDPQMQVSVMCHQPDFVAVDYTVIRGAVTNALVDGNPTEYEFNYDGNVPTGFTLRVKASSARPEYEGRLVVVNESRKFKETFDLTKIAIDRTKFLSLTTIESARRVRVLSFFEEPPLSVLRQKTKGSPWPMLRPGKNIFSVGAEFSGLRFELVYYDRYGGL